jgi:hypothetical protein
MICIQMYKINRVWFLPSQGRSLELRRRPPGVGRTGGQRNSVPGDGHRNHQAFRPGRGRYAVPSSKQQRSCSAPEDQKASPCVTSLSEPVSITHSLAVTSAIGGSWSTRCTPGWRLRWPRSSCVIRSIRWTSRLTQRLNDSLGSWLTSCWVASGHLDWLSRAHSTPLSTRCGLCREPTMRRQRSEALIWRQAP